MRAFLGPALRASAAAITLILSSVGSAQAAVYAGAWDPPFGSPPLQDLNWSGTFSVETNCNSASSGTTLVPGDCGDVDVLSASVRLFGPIPGQTIDVTLGFDPNGLIDSVTKLVWAGNTITQLQTGLSEWKSLIGTNYEVALQFVIDGDVAITNPVQPPGALPTTYSGPVLFIRGPGGSNDNAQGKGAEKSKGADVQILRAKVEDACCTPVFTGLVREGSVAIPEPGVVTLLAGALIAAGWLRHLRSERRPEGRRKS